MKHQTENPAAYMLALTAYSKRSIYTEAALPLGYKYTGISRKAV